MAPTLATSRLRKELVNLQKDPPPGIIAEPKESDILVWYYAIRGPIDTPYERGAYIGKITFPPEYPLKPPSIYMQTPSGRFETNTKICMSMSDFHPESWNPLWSVSSIIQGIQSFMASDELTTGATRASEADRKRLAEASHGYNATNLGNLFGGNLESAFQKAEQARNKPESSTKATSNRTNHQSLIRRTPRSSEKQEVPVPDKDNGQQEGEQAKEETTLTPQEQEKRRQRNAKKRAKAKAKKGAANDQDDNDILGEVQAKLSVDSEA